MLDSLRALANSSEAILVSGAAKSNVLLKDDSEVPGELVPEPVSVVVAAQPVVTGLATSRKPLGLPGYRVVAVPSLVAGVTVELFCHPAGAMDDSLVFSSADRAAIRLISELLEGIPL